LGGGDFVTSTEEWARAFGISTEPIPPEVSDHTKPCARSAREIAVRAVILQGIVAVGHGVSPEPVSEWYHEQRIWSAVSPMERAFLRNPAAMEPQRNRLCWHAEAEWTLLWAIGKVEAPGLPTQVCDSRRLVDEIIPALGDSISGFVAGAKLVHPGLLLAEDDRTYDLWCRVCAARRAGTRLPADLNYDVLRERRYAFEWLDGNQKWDEVTCDA
jgi:hypothetical protein